MGGVVGRFSLSSLPNHAVVAFAHAACSFHITIMNVRPPVRRQWVDAHASIVRWRQSIFFASSHHSRHRSRRRHRLRRSRRNCKTTFNGHHTGSIHQSRSVSVLYARARPCSHATMVTSCQTPCVCGSRDGRNNTPTVQPSLLFYHSPRQTSSIPCRVYRLVIVPRPDDLSAAVAGRGATDSRLKVSLIIPPLLPSIAV